MNITYDQQADAAYITLTTEPAAQTVPVGECLHVDLDSHGKIVGIEILGISLQPALAQALISQRASGVPIEFRS